MDVHFIFTWLLNMNALYSFGVTIVHATLKRTLLLTQSTGKKGKTEKKKENNQRMNLSRSCGWPWTNPKVFRVPSHFCFYPSWVYFCSHFSHFLRSTSFIRNSTSVYSIYREQPGNSRHPTVLQSPSTLLGYGSFNSPGRSKSSKQWDTSYRFLKKKKKYH